MSKVAGLSGNFPESEYDRVTGNVMSTLVCWLIANTFFVDILHSQRVIAEVI